MRNKNILKRHSVVLFVLAILWASCTPEPSGEYFIKNGKNLAIHCDNQAIEKLKKPIRIRSENGKLFANKIPWKGDFKIEAKLRILNPGATAAAFIIDENYFGFDGQDNNFFAHGKLFGDELISLKSSEKYLSPSRWVDFCFCKKDSLLSFLVNTDTIYSLVSNWTFSGKMGFRPQRAIMEMDEFRAEGDLIEVSIREKSYGIPTIDISHETNRQITIDKEKGQYLGHPTTILLEDQKTMYIVYPKGHGRGAIVMKKSEDTGLSWSERLSVPENWSTSQEVPTLYPVIDKDGKKRIIMFSGLYPIRMAYSEDDGESWSPLKAIGDYGGIVAISDMHRKANGDYLAYFHDDGRFINADGSGDKVFKVYKIRSSDGGLSWSNPEVICSHPRMNLCEPGLIVSPDGKKIAMLLRENSRRYNSGVIFSEDDGENWSDPVELPASLTGDRHQAVYCPDGRIVVSFRDVTHTTPTKGDFVAWVGRWEDIVNGKEGQYRIRLLDNKNSWDCGYPGMEVLPDGTVIATTYGKWDPDHTQYIKSVRFKLEEIDKKAREMPIITDVFTSGDSLYPTYRIPSLLATQKRILLAFCEGRGSLSDHAANDIVLRRSIDSGASWEEIQIVYEAGEDCLSNPQCLEVRETGRIILFFQKYPKGFHEREVVPGYEGDKICRTFICYSDDDGISWSEPKEITRSVKRPEATSMASGPGNGIQLSRGPYKGRLIMPFNQGPFGDWKVYAAYSDDLGKTWHYGKPAPNTDDSKGNEVQMFEMEDGSIRLNSRSAYGKKLRKTAISRDGGEHWTSLENVPDLIEPECMGSSIRFRYQDGEKSGLVIYSGPHSQNQRIFGTLNFSYDDGKSWPDNYLIYQGSFAYSSMTKISEKEIGILFERDQYGKISFLTLNLDDIIE